MWHASRLLELRERARIPLRRDEIVEFLSRGYENCAQNFESCCCVQIHTGNPHGWPIGHAVVFTWTGDDGPHPAIDDILDVMRIDAVRTSFMGRDAIVGLLGDRRAHQPLNLLHRPLRPRSPTLTTRGIRTPPSQRSTPPLPAPSEHTRLFAIAGLDAIIVTVSSLHAARGAFCRLRGCLPQIAREHKVPSLGYGG